MLSPPLQELPGEPGNSRYLPAIRETGVFGGGEKYSQINLPAGIVKTLDRRQIRDPPLPDPQRQVIQGHHRLHGKGSVYEGGVAVPMIVSGRGVTRTGERENALVSSVDLFATIADLAGTDTVEFNDSKSFTGLFSNAGSGPPQLRLRGSG